MVEKIVLDNGLRIVSRKMPYVRSCALGIWVGNGSRHEPAELSGISHFIEHMVFKGTEKRSTLDIAKDIDALGGQVNAFTTKECTCFHMTTLDTHLRQGAEILADMFFHARFGQEEMNLERGVVLEEIDMYEDSPEDLATEKIFENCYAGCALGRPILGYKETLNQMDSETMRRYQQTYYRPADTVVALAGSFTKEDLDYLCQLFSGMQGEGHNPIDVPVYTPKITCIPKEIEQQHLCLGFPGMASVSEDRYGMIMMSSILGGGMSSRLFQQVREQNGLCYSVYTFNASHLDTGMFHVYTALNKGAEEKALDLIRQVLEEFKENGPTEEELARVRDRAETSIYMSRESTQASMSQLGKGELFLHRSMPDEEVIQRYQQVTKEQVQALAQKYLDFSQASICVVGKPEQETFYRRFMA
jgi:predicted Zn-dependent peptidase